MLMTMDTLVLNDMDTLELNDNRHSDVSLTMVTVMKFDNGHSDV